MLSFPRGTEMFQFPRFPPTALCVQAAVHTPLRVVGFPIRTSPDQCLVDGSPELFAVTHVLHRFLAPRHPPLALISLKKQIIYSCSKWPSKDSHLKDARACSAVLKVLPDTGTIPDIRHRKGRQTRQARQCGMKKPPKGLPQNRREDNVHLNPLHQEGPNPYNQCALLRQTCQCTNRCVMQPQRTNVSDRLMKHSLERR